MSGQTLLAGALCVALAGCAAGGGPERCRMGRATDIPLRLEAGHLFMQPLLNGQAINMVLDTGAQFTTLTTDAADRLALNTVPLRATVEGIGGSRDAYGFIARTFQIGRLTGRNFQLVATDMKLSSPKMTVDGLVGGDFLGAYDVDLDLPDHKATLFKVVEGCESPSSVLDGSLYDIAFSRSDPRDPRAHISVRIGGKTLIAVVDSGARNTAIFRDAARRLGLDIARLTTDRHFHATGIGPHAQDAVRHVMTPISIGDLTVENMPVAIIDQHSMPDTDMLIGLDFLLRVHAWFSFSSHSLILQYPPRPTPH